MLHSFFFVKKSIFICVCPFFVVPLHRIFVYMRAILLAIGVVMAAMLLLCVGVILRKDHSFRSQHIHENKKMKEDKIHCAISEDKLEQRKKNKQIDVNNL